MTEASLPDDGVDWRALVARAAGGEADARNALVERYQPRLRSMVHRELEQDFRRSHRWMLPVFSTRDVVQDVFVGLMHSLDAEEAEFPNEAAFLAYLATMVRHRLLDAVRFHEAKRRDARRRATPDTDDESGESGPIERPDESGVVPDVAAQLAEHAALLREVLDALPERHRVLVQMRVVDGATFGEIATALGYASQETARQSRPSDC